MTEDARRRRGGYSVRGALAGLGVHRRVAARRRRAARRPTLRGRYLFGMFLMAVGYLASPGSPRARWQLLVTFVVAGFGNGADARPRAADDPGARARRLAARVFGIRDALTAWAFALSFIAAGGLASTFGSRAVMIRPRVRRAGLVWAVTRGAGALRGRRSDPSPTGEPGPPLADA